MDTSSPCDSQNEACLPSPQADVFENKAESICQVETTLIAGSDGLSPRGMKYGPQRISHPTVATGEKDDASQHMFNMPKQHRDGLGNSGCYGFNANGLNQTLDGKDCYGLNANGLDRRTV